MIIPRFWIVFNHLCFRVFIFFLTDTCKLLLRFGNILNFAPQRLAFGILVIPLDFDAGFGRTSSILNHSLNQVISRCWRYKALPAHGFLLSGW